MSVAGLGGGPVDRVVGRGPRRLLVVVRRQVVEAGRPPRSRASSMVVDDAARRRRCCGRGLPGPPSSSVAMGTPVNSRDHVGAAHEGVGLRGHDHDGRRCRAAGPGPRRPGPSTTITMGTTPEQRDQRPGGLPQPSRAATPSPMSAPLDASYDDQRAGARRARRGPPRRWSRRRPRRQRPPLVAGSISTTTAGRPVDVARPRPRPRPARGRAAATVGGIAELGPAGRRAGYVDDRASPERSRPVLARSWVRRRLRGRRRERQDRAGWMPGWCGGPVGDDLAEHVAQGPGRGRQ